MARVLIATSAAKGQLNPMLGVAQLLKESEHEVSWLCVDGPNEQLKALKIEQFKSDAPAPKDASLKAAIDAIPAQVHSLRHTISHLNPDVVAVHPALYGVILSCELEGKKWAGLAASLIGLAPQDFDSAATREVRELEDQRAKAFAKSALKFRHSHCLSPHANMVFSTNDFTRELAAAPAGTHQVGPSIVATRGDETKFDWKKLNFDSPLVFVAGIKGEALEKLVEAAGLIDAQFVIAGEVARTPKNVIATPFAPQLKLLERATAFVTSGGAASVMECTWAGVPMLVCPQAGEDFVASEFVRKAKNGNVANLVKDDVAEKLRALLDPESAPLRPAARLKDAYQARDGAKTAAELIAKLAS